jgi:hypothetical protein
VKTVAPTLLFALVTGLMSTGCEWVALGIALSDDDCESDCCGDECWDDPPEAPPPDPPTIDFTIADWPPMGSASTLTISAQADNGLGNTTFFFRNTVTRSFNGETSATLSVTGAELGEGFGRLEVDVASWDGSISRRGVDGLLVDLTAPTAYVDDLNVVRAVGDHFSFYMADAWIVSGCELTVGDQIFTEQLDPGFPPTLGVDWDFSLVSIPSEDLPIGTHSASLRVWGRGGQRVDPPGGDHDRRPAARRRDHLARGGRDARGLFRSAGDRVRRRPPSPSRSRSTSVARSSRPAPPRRPPSPSPPRTSRRVRPRSPRPPSTRPATAARRSSATSCSWPPSSSRRGR